ncbi:MAG: hypothetical protein WC872_02145 [Candidatus Absconditabacterales bacterium]
MFKKNSTLFLFLAGLLFFSLAFVYAGKASLGDVTLMFCNDNQITKDLSFMTDGGKNTPLCMQFQNKSEEDLAVTVGFVDGVLTNDSYKSKACKNEGEGTMFGKYVNLEQKTFIVKAKSTETKNANVKFPGGFSGVVHGCITYYIADAPVGNLNVGKNAMFNILVRKAKFVDALVGANFNRGISLKDFPSKGISTNPKINLSFEKSDLILKLNVVNSGSIDEKVSISGTISNIFGYKKDFNFDSTPLYADSIIQLIKNIGGMPYYKGLFTLKLNLISLVNLDFNTANFPEQIKNPITISESVKIFIFPWIIVGAIIGLVILILLLVYLFKHIKIEKK